MHFRFYATYRVNINYNQLKNNMHPEVTENYFLCEIKDSEAIVKRMNIN